MLNRTYRKQDFALSKEVVHALLEQAERDLALPQAIGRE